MNELNREIKYIVKNAGGDFCRFLDISPLLASQNRGFPNAVLIGTAIDPKFIEKVFCDPEYIHTLDDEYALTEDRIGKIADELAKFLMGKGYKAISQSDSGQIAAGSFNFDKKESALPHKTVAMLSASGWIGKNNLFITPEYGAAQCLCTVLNDATLEVESHEPRLSKCNKCNICVAICEKGVLKGRTWGNATSREEIIDVYGCSTCLKCLVHCPWTQKYRRRS